MAGLKTSGVGHFAIPTAPAAGTAITSGLANVFTTTYVALIASTAAALYITGIFVESAAALGGTYDVVQLATGGAGSEAIVGQYLISLSTGSTTATGYRQIYPPIAVAVSTRIAAKTADSVGSKATLVTLECIAQSNVVDDGIAITTVTTVTNQLTATAIATGVWTDATAGDFTTALSVGKSVMNGVTLGTGLTINAYTGNTVQTGDAFAIVKSGGTGDNAAIKTKTDFLPSATAGAAGGVQIAGSNAATTYVTLTSTGAFTVNGVAAVSQTGDGFAVVKSGGTGDNAAIKTKTDFLPSVTAGGAGGVFIAGTNAATTVTTSFTTTFTGNLTGSVNSVTGLTASNLDATISSRMATYTQPTGFLAATFPSGTIANTTNITAGTIATVTTVTGLTASNLDTTVSSRSTYAGGAVASVTGNVAGNVTGSVGSVVGAVGSVTGLTAANLDATVSSRSTYAGGAVASVTGAVGSVTGAVGSVTAAVTVTGTPDVNVAQVNGTVVKGDGAGTPWGP